MRLGVELGVQVMQEGETGLHVRYVEALGSGAKNMLIE